MIAAIDEEGKIKEDAELNYLDVHLIKRNEKGQPLGSAGVALPEEWYEGQKHDFHGKELLLSHPAKLAYFKIHGTRDFDQTDLRYLAETSKLSLGDIDEITKVIDLEFNKQKETVDAVLERFIVNLKKESSSDEIFNLLLEDPEISEKAKTEGSKNRLRELSELIFKDLGQGEEKIKGTVIEWSEIKKSSENKKEKVQKLKDWVLNAKQNRNLREKI